MTPVTTIYWVSAVLTVLLGSAVLVILKMLVDRIEELRRRLEGETDNSLALHKVLYDTNKGVGELVIVVAPLLEQTDWMTGRWAGQFDTLVKMEQERNRRVVAARQAMNDHLPIVREATVRGMTGGFDVSAE